MKKGLRGCGVDYLPEDTNRGVRCKESSGSIKGGELHYLLRRPATLIKGNIRENKIWAPALVRP
jgi:hypothetical protein